MNTTPVAQASVELVLDNTKFKPAIQNALKGHELKVDTAKAERDIVKFTKSTARALKTVSSIMLQASAVTIGVAGTGVHEYLKRGSVEAKKYQLALAGIKDAQARIGGIVFNMKIGDRTTVQWMEKFADYLNRIDPKRVEQLVKAFGGLTISALFIGQLGRFVAYFDKLKTWNTNFNKVFGGNGINISPSASNISQGINKSTLASTAATVGSAAYTANAIKNSTAKVSETIVKNAAKTVSNASNIASTAASVTSTTIAGRIIASGRAINALPEAPVIKQIAPSALERRGKKWSRFPEGTKQYDLEYDIVDGKAVLISDNREKIGQHFFDASGRRISEQEANYINSIPPHEFKRRGTGGIRRTRVNPSNLGSAFASKSSLGLLGMAEYAGGITAAAFGGWQAGSMIKDYRPNMLKGRSVQEGLSEVQDVLRGENVWGNLYANKGKYKNYSREELIRMRQRNREMSAISAGVGALSGASQYFKNVEETGYATAGNPLDLISNLRASKKGMELEAGKYEKTSAVRELIEKSMEGIDEAIKSLNASRNMGDILTAKESLKDFLDFEKENAQKGHTPTVEESKKYTMDMAILKKGLQEKLSTSITSKGKMAVGSKEWELENAYQESLETMIDSLSNAISGIAERIAAKEERIANYRKTNEENIIEAKKKYTEEEGKRNKEQAASLNRLINKNKPLTTTQLFLQSALTKAFNKGDVKELNRIGGIANAEDLNKVANFQQGTVQNISATELPSFMQSMTKGPDIGGIAAILEQGKEAAKSAKEGLDKTIETFKKSLEDFIKGQEENNKILNGISKALTAP